MTELETFTPLEYTEIAEVDVLGGVVPSGDDQMIHVFLSIGVLDDDGIPLKMTFGMSPWEALRISAGLSAVAIQITDMQVARIHEAEVAQAEVKPKREHSAYL